MSFCFLSDSGCPLEVYSAMQLRACRANCALQRLAEATGLQIHAGFGPHVNMWWGPRGHTEPLHIDTADGTLLQLCGHKRVTLFPRDCWVDLYPFPPTKGAQHIEAARFVCAPLGPPSPSSGSLGRLAALHAVGEPPNQWGVLLAARAAPLSRGESRADSCADALDCRYYL